ncbi:MAG: hypothetical protein ABI889_12735 [Gemmatimonadota bacterium]
MKRVVAAAIGFVLWSVLWLGYNQILLTMGLISTDMSQALSDPKPLLLLLLGSIIISVAAGYVTARVAGSPSMPALAVLGVLLLATGIFFESRMWHVIPLWYHLAFLLLLIPMTVLGARMVARTQGIG